MAYLDYGESDCNSIFEIDPSGSVTEVFETADYLSGMCHSNALRYSQTEDVYVMTDVSQDIFVINRANGSVSWRASEMLSGGISVLGGTQHAQHLLDDGILIFANRWNGQNASAAVQYDLSGQQVWIYEGNQFSANLGDVQRLPGGNTMVTYSNDSVARQVTPDKDVVMEFSGAAGTSIGYALWRETLYGPPPDILE